MTDIVLTPITSGYNLAKINANFVKVQDVVNNDVLHNIGGNNVMHQPLDMNFNRILNVFTDVNDPQSLLTVGAADARYYNVTGDTLTGTMNVNGQHLIGLPLPVATTEPIRKGEYDSQVTSLVSTITANKLQSVRGQDGEQLTALPPSNSRANKVMGFDFQGNPLGVLPATGSGTELAIDLANGATVGKGASMVAYSGSVTVKSELDKTFPSADSFFASAIVFPAGTRVMARTGEVWDVSAAGLGEFNHPVAGYGVTAVLQPNGNLSASCYNVSSTSTAAVNYAGIQLGLNRLSSRGAGILELPAANTANPLQIAGRINIPGAVGMRGAAWFNTVLSFTTSDGGVTWDSSSILEDVDLRGNNIAQDGLMEVADVNRVSGRRIRIQDFTRYGLSVGMHGVVNNSLIQDVQARFCGEANIALCRALNTTFLNINTDLEMTSTLGARGLKVFDLFPGEGGNRMCRNTRFIGGIFERGAGDYQLEVEQADGLTFIGTEFNNGGVATARVRKGSATFFTNMFTLMGTNDILHADAGTRVSMYEISSSGTGGKSLADMVEGPVLIDGSLSKRNTLRSLRWYSPDKFGDATTTLDPLTGCRVVTVAGGVDNRISIVTTGGLNTAGTMRAYDVEIVVSKITSGSFVPHLVVNTSPYRIAGPALTLGVNRFTILTDLASSGSIELIGSAAADFTLLSTVVRAF